MKKRIKTAVVLCLTGILCFSHRVNAREFMQLSAGSRSQMEYLVQKKILNEQRNYLLQVKLLKKIDLEQIIRERPVYIPKTMYEVTNREQRILERIVEAEATDKDLKSKILVANVILNRVRVKEFPNTIEAVVFQRENGQVQFSPTADGRYDSVTITKSTRQSVKRALGGEDYSEGALYFVEKTMATPGNVSWFERSLTRLFTYEGHSFYK